MQTFLPYSDLARSVACLDRARLGKQRVEAWHIYSALIDPDYGWQNHPAVRMWRGHPETLLAYGQLACAEWIARGYEDNMLDRITVARQQLLTLPGESEPNPLWLGDEAFHASHRSNLLRKDPVWYGKFGWTELPDLPYVWPR